MSTLTKVLIILLTVSSIFLCGTVVTYVANADNYRQKYSNLNTRFQAAEKRREDAIKQLNENIAKFDQLEKQLRTEITSLKAEVDKLQVELSNAEREKATLLQKVNDMASVVEAATKTAKQQTELFENAQKELQRLRAVQIKQEKELKETSATLIEKLAIIDTLEAEKKRLIEEKTELQNRLDELLRPMGKTAVLPEPVTQQKEIVTAQPTIPAVEESIGLKGLITDVDLKNSIASISIGAADGVKEGMKFHVIRGDEFICDLLIIDVETDKAIGVMELVQQQPKKGDKVSTNFDL